MLAILFIIFVSPAYADEFDMSFKGLVATYLSLPTPANEQFLENIANNPMISSGLVNASGELKDILKKIRFKSGVVKVEEKQVLLAQIYKAAILEINGPNAAEQLEALILHGEIPGQPAAAKLPSIHRLASLVSLYEIVFLLLQREESVRVLALDILNVKGNHYPSSDSFARGLARYTAISATDAKQFHQALSVVDSLYKLRSALIRPGHPRDRMKYRIATFHHEVSNPSYNPAAGDPSQRSKIVDSLAVDYRKYSAELKYDIILSLLRFPENAKAKNLFKQIIYRSNDIIEVHAAIEALGWTGSPEYREGVFNNIDRLSQLPVSGNDASRHPIDRAVETLLGPILRGTLGRGELTEDQRAARHEILPKLMAHSNATVRAKTVWVVNSAYIPAADRVQLHQKLLNDPSEQVRRAATDQFFAADMNWKHAQLFHAKLNEMAQLDPSAAVREYAVAALSHFNRLKSDDEWSAPQKCGVLFIRR